MWRLGGGRLFQASEASEERFGGGFGGGLLVGVLGVHVSQSSEVSEEGFWGGYRWGVSGLNRSWCPSICVFIPPLLLVYLMSHPPPSRSQYSVLIWYVI